MQHRTGKFVSVVGVAIALTTIAGGAFYLVGEILAGRGLDPYLQTNGINMNPIGLLVAIGICVVVAIIGAIATGFQRDERDGPQGRIG